MTWILVGAFFAICFVLVVRAMRREMRKIEKGDAKAERALQLKGKRLESRIQPGYDFAKASAARQRASEHDTARMKLAASRANLPSEPSHVTPFIKREAR